MSVRIRLKRTGMRNAISFRVVVMDQRSSRDGKSIEELGFYNPGTKEEKINLDRFAYWLGVGAQSTATVNAIAKRAKEGRSFKDLVRKPSVSRKAIAKAKAAEEAKAAAAAEAAAPAQEAAAPAEA